MTQHTFNPATSGNQSTSNSSMLKAAPRTAQPTPQSAIQLSAVHMGKVLLGLANDYRRRVLEHCREHGHPKIRGSHSSLLSYIGIAPINLTTLAERSAITQQAVGKLVRELERMGYVECRVDEHDKRAKLIQLSPRGLELTNDLEEIIEEVRGEYRVVLGDSALAAFEEQLNCTARALHIGERQRVGQR